MIEPNKAADIVDIQTNVIEALRQRVAELEVVIEDFAQIERGMEEELAALKAGQSKPAYYEIITGEGIKWVSENVPAIPGLIGIPLYRTPPTCFSAGDMADAQAKAAQIEREECASLCDRFAMRGMHPAECAAAIRGLTA